MNMFTKTKSENGSELNFSHKLREIKRKYLERIGYILRVKKKNFIKVFLLKRQD